MLAWEIPVEDWDRMSVKTGRYKPGTQELEILFSCLPSEWFLETVAERYGKGTYRIQAGPGPHRTKNTTIHVSAEYARDAGFQTTPPMPQTQPDPNQLMAARTAQQALSGPVDPLSLAQMIQTAVDTALARAQPAAPAMNPMDMFFKGMEANNAMLSKSMETARSMMGIQPSERAEPREKGWIDLVAELGPIALQTLQTAMKTSPAQPPAFNGPHHGPTPQPQAIGIHQGPPPPIQPLNTGEQTMPYPDPPQEAVPILTVMKGQAFILKRYLDGPTTAEELADSLFGMVGPDLEASVLAAADHVAMNGPGILGHAAPEFATEKAAHTLIAWAKLIRTPEAGMEGGE